MLYVYHHDFSEINRAREKRVPPEVRGDGANAGPLAE